MLLFIYANSECPNGWLEFANNRKCYKAFEAGQGKLLDNINLNWYIINRILYRFDLISLIPFLISVILKTTSTAYKKKNLGI